MPLFICAKCGCIDNTAISSYWHLDIGGHFNDLEYYPPLEAYRNKPLCSECGCVRYVRKADGTIVKMVIPGKWHGKFPKEEASEEYKRRAGKNGIIN